MTDKRLALCLFLAKGRQENPGARFREWARLHAPHHTFPYVKTLARIGAKPDPAAELARLRDKNSKANYRLQKKRKMDNIHLRARLLPGLQGAKNVYIRLNKKEKEDFLEWLGKNSGTS